MSLKVSAAHPKLPQHCESTTLQNKVNVKLIIKEMNGKAKTTGKTTVLKIHTPTLFKKKTKHHLLENQLK